MIQRVVSAINPRVSLQHTVALTQGEHIRRRRQTQCTALQMGRARDL